MKEMSKNLPTSFKTTTVCPLVPNYLYSSHIKIYPLVRPPRRLIYYGFRLNSEVSTLRSSKSDPGTIQCVGCVIFPYCVLFTFLWLLMKQITFHIYNGHLYFVQFLFKSFVYISMGLDFS